MKVIIFLLLLLSPFVARAEENKDPLPIVPVEFSAWNPCWFYATTTDFGIVYLRPRLSIGYGKPHTHWVGVDINPTVSLSGPGGYAGFRFSSPYVDFRVGNRLVFSLFRSALEPKDSYVEDDVFIRPVSGLSTRSSYLSGEAELTLTLPLGPGAVSSELAYTHILLSPKDRYVFEERLNVVVDPPWIAKARLGYQFSVPIFEIPVGLQPASEILFANGRDEPTIRAGFLLKTRITEQLSLRANFLSTVFSPDKIGFTGMNFGEITLRYRRAWQF